MNNEQVLGDFLIFYSQFLILPDSLTPPTST